MNAFDQDQMRQTLLELHYGLLDDEPADELRRRIATEPVVASLWAETLSAADQFAKVAKLETKIEPPPLWYPDRLPLGRSGSGNENPVHARKPLRSVWKGPTLAAVIAASIAMMIVGAGYFNSVPPRPRAALYVQADLESSPALQSPASVRITTKRTNGGYSGATVGSLPVVPASVSFSILARGTTLFSGTETTGDDGSGRISLPPDLVIPQGAKLRLVARPLDGSLASSTISVPLEPTRCLTTLAIDRPVYRPGETVYFRSLTLTRRHHRPDVTAPIRYELLGPDGGVVPGATTEGVTDRGVGNGAFRIPTTAPGGTYTLVVKSLDGFFPDEQRAFQVRDYRVPQFRKKIDLDARSYGPGDQVQAKLEVKRSDASPANQVTVRVVVRVDDQIIHERSTQTSSLGTLAIEFMLPSLIERGEGLLTVMIDDGATKESISKTVPIQLGRVDVEFFPEGGYLVDGLANRVYFTARNSTGQPIELAGEVQDRSGKQVALIQTSRDGMGRFEMTPQSGQTYSLKVTSPVDVINTPTLPRAVADLPVIDTGDGVFGIGQSLAMTVASTRKRSVIVRAVCRGRLVASQTVPLKLGQENVTLDIPDDVAGVVRLTILDAETLPARPLVERLVFRRSKEKLRVQVVEPEDSLDRVPGDLMRLTLQVTNELGEPTPAILGVAVVDEASLSLDAVDRPNLETQVWLASEIKSPEDLEHADFYLGESSEAAAALDLLLGTQGWRRFISGSDTAAEVDFQDQLARLLQLDGDPSKAAASVAGSSLSTYRWARYQSTVTAAWKRLVLQTRFLLSIILGIWLITIWARMRANRGAAMMASLILVVSLIAVQGCGSSETSSRVGSVVTEEAGDMKLPRLPAERFAQLNPQAKQLVDASRVPWSERARAASAIQGDGSDGNAAISAKELRELLAARGLDADALAASLVDELRFPIRQYAHRHRSTDDEVREDFAETLYWQPLLITDSRGQAQIRFDLSDSVTTFRIAIDGHTSGGRIGSGQAVVTSRLPFQIEPKLPLEVSVGDRVDLPVGIINATDQEAELEFAVTTDPAFELTQEATQTISVSAGKRTRQIIPMKVASVPLSGLASVRVQATGDSLSDSVSRQVRVAAAGYPASQSITGTTADTAPVQVTVSERWVPDSLRASVHFYPSPLADVVTGVESILREPRGCFEQASATNYPNTMVLDYLKQTGTQNADVESRARGMLDRGYSKLIQYECGDLGFEWFGSDPGHEALSAFGLMQFTDMARLMPIDQEMIDRTRTWLLGRRDGQGGFRRNPRHLHVWSVKQNIVDAYVLWAISEADVAAGQPLRTGRELSAELDKLVRVADASDDPYLIALTAATMANAKRDSEANRLMLALSRLQRDDGSLVGQTTVTSSGGLSRTMETTALSAIAWAKNPRFSIQAGAATTWISANRTGNGGFGSTQATVLALKAITATAGRGTPKSGGRVEVKLDGKVIGQASLPDQAEASGAISIDGLGESIQSALKAEVGSNRATCELEIVGPPGSRLSYSIDVSYHTEEPSSDRQCPVEVTTAWAGNDDDAVVTVSAGEAVSIQAKLVNLFDQGQPMTVAIVGLPGGVEPNVDQLDQQKQAGEFAYYELRGRDVVFYYRDLEPGQTKIIRFDAVAAVPGRYTGPASRAYLYYTAEQKRWTRPLEITIEP